VLVEETGASNVVPKPFVEEYGFRSILLVPLISRNEAVGALLVDEPGIARRFTFREIATVQGIANLAAGPIRSIRSYERAKRDLRTKEALLEEAHLGVSDCLAGLARFESNGADSATRDQMETTIRRLQSVATVHRLLAENHGEHVPLPTLISRLSQSVRAQFTGQGKRVRILVPDNDIAIDQRRAAPLGIVLGELLEALTAFPFTQEDEGTVIVEAQEDGLSVIVEVRIAAIAAARTSFAGAISEAAKGVLERTVREQLGGSLQLEEDRPVAIVTFPKA
jgi:two-component sensor histidine kinase